MIEKTIKLISNYFFKNFTQNWKNGYRSIVARFSVISGFEIGMTCAIFRNLGNTPTVNELLTKLDRIGANRDLIDLINFVEYVEILELLFFKDVIVLPTFSEFTGEK